MPLRLYKRLNFTLKVICRKHFPAVFRQRFDLSATATSLYRGKLHQFQGDRT